MKNNIAVVQEPTKGNKVSKSPFVVFDSFIDGATIDAIINPIVQDIVSIEDAEYVKSYELPPELLSSIGNALVAEYPYLSYYYGTQIVGIKKFSVSVLDVTDEPKVHVPNHEWLRQKWVKLNRGDLIATLFLTSDITFNEAAAEDAIFSKGGSIEFTSFNFTHPATAGTLVIYPCTPHFMRAFSEVTHGVGLRIDMHIVTETPYIYDPQQFPGTFTEWFD